MVTDSFQILANNLEKQELENAAAGTPVSVMAYSQLLAIYLYQNELCNAKYLWKRIPNPIKTSSKELQNVWEVGKKLWQRDFPAVYKALAEAWSPDLMEIMEALKAKVRQRAGNLVATAYSSINLDTLADFTGMSVEEAQVQARALGWEVDDAANIVIPCKPQPGPVQVVSCEEQLSKLTDFVSFLEN